MDVARLLIGKCCDVTAGPVRYGGHESRVREELPLFKAMSAQKWVMAHFLHDEGAPSSRTAVCYPDAGQRADLGWRILQ